MKKKSSLSKSTVREIVRHIAKDFSVEKIILFGSHARGTAGKDSDIDLLVIMPAVESKRKKQVELRLALHDIRIPKDIIVTTSAEFLNQQMIPGSISRAAEREGKVLYEKAA